VSQNHFPDGRCAAAHADDHRPCDGLADAIQVVDRTGSSVAACLLHGAVLLASLDGGRVYPLNGPDGSAIAAYTRARSLRPFDFLTMSNRRRPPDRTSSAPTARSRKAR
jgi:hypothetical protein